MKISFRFIKRLLLAGVFATSNVVYAQSPTTAQTQTQAQTQAQTAAIAELGQKAATVNAGTPSQPYCTNKPDPNSKTDQAGGQLCQNMSDLGTSIDTMNRTTGVNTGEAQAVGQAYDAFRKDWDACAAKHNMAANLCLENLNENISQAAQVGGMLVAGGNASMGLNGACNQVANFMDIANKVLTLYNSACGAAQAYCSNVCKSAVKGLEDVQAKADAVKCTPNTTTYQACQTSIAEIKAKIKQHVAQENDAGNKVSTAGKNELCAQKYGKLLITAAAGLLSILATLKASKQCDEQSKAAEASPEEMAGAEPPAPETGCEDPAKAATPECMCQKNPRMQGCSNGLEKSGEGSYASMMNGMTGNPSSPEGAPPIIPNLGSGLNVARDPSSAGSSPGGGAGGGSGLGGSGGGSGGGAADGGMGPGKKMDTNILSGFSGGSGGNWARGGAGAASKLGAYLPGGAKDPSKLNGGSPGANEVTGQGGKSNWEKVRDRYRDNNNSLLTNK